MRSWVGWGEVEMALKVSCRRFNAGEYVLRAGDPGDSMFFINSGRVAAVVNGHELEPMRMGQFFGEIALVSHCAQDMGQSG